MAGDSYLLGTALLSTRAKKKAKVDPKLAKRSRNLGTAEAAVADVLEKEAVEDAAQEAAMADAMSEAPAEEMPAEEAAPAAEEGDLGEGGGGGGGILAAPAAPAETAPSDLPAEPSPWEGWTDPDALSAKAFLLNREQAKQTAFSAQVPSPLARTSVSPTALRTSVSTQSAPTVTRLPSSTQVTRTVAPAPAPTVTRLPAPEPVVTRTVAPAPAPTVTRTVAPAPTTTTRTVAPTPTTTSTLTYRVRGDDAKLASQIPGITDEAWSQFVAVMRTATVGAVSSSNALGMFELKPRRLADFDLVVNLSCTRAPNGRIIWVGEFVPPLTTKKFLTDPRLQYATFVRSMRDYVGKLERREIRPGGGDGMTLSGALAILHRAGPAGLKNWQEGKRFQDTVALYERANGIF